MLCFCSVSQHSVWLCHTQLSCNNWAAESTITNPGRSVQQCLKKPKTQNSSSILYNDTKCKQSNIFTHLGFTMKVCGSIGSKSVADKRASSRMGKRHQLTLGTHRALVAQLGKSWKVESLVELLLPLVIAKWNVNVAYQVLQSFWVPTPGLPTLERMSQIQK